MKTDDDAYRREPSSGDEPERTQINTTIQDEDSSKPNTLPKSADQSTPYEGLPQSLQKQL